MTDLLEAFARLPYDLQHVKLWIVGEGPLKRKLQLKAIETGDARNASASWARAPTCPP